LLRRNLAAATEVLAKRTTQRQQNPESPENPKIAVNQVNAKRVLIAARRIKRWIVARTANAVCRTMMEKIAVRNLDV
jgi:hypothetical protein